jgi:hypothetical protein
MVTNLLSTNIEQSYQNYSRVNMNQQNFIYQALLNGWNVKYLGNETFEFKKKKNCFTKNIDWNQDLDIEKILTKNENKNSTNSVSTASTISLNNISTTSTNSTTNSTTNSITNSTTQTNGNTNSTIKKKNKK